MYIIGVVCLVIIVSLQHSWIVNLLRRSNKDKEELITEGKQHVKVLLEYKELVNIVSSIRKCRTYNDYVKVNDRLTVFYSTTIFRNDDDIEENIS